MLRIVMRVAQGNIGIAGQNQRFRAGLILFGVSSVATVFALDARLDRVFLALLFVPFFLSSLAFFQGLYRNCVSLAMQGMRDDNDDGPEAVVDRQKLKTAKRIGMRTVATSAVTALVMTLLVQLVR